MYSKRFLKDTIEILELKSVPNGIGGTKNEWTVIGPPFKGFLDTPNTDEQLKYHQRNETLDRFLFYAFGAATIPKTARLRYTHPKTNTVELYELIGKPSDQGGQHRYMRQALKQVM